MSLTVCCIVAHALRGSLSCCAHSAGAPILNPNTAMSRGRHFVMNLKNSLFILAFNEANAPIPQQFLVLANRPNCRHDQKTPELGRSLPVLKKTRST